MSDYLLPELYRRILLKLPVRSVLRCTAVCKQWRSFITNPSFVSDHTSLSRQNHLLLQPSTTGSNGEFSLYLDTDGDDSPLRLSQTLNHEESGRPQVVGSVNGLVLLVRSDLDYILWNPSIRRSVTLPRPRLVPSQYTVQIGFGFDPATSDYKVVRLDHFLCGNRPPLLVEVYSHRDRNWRRVVPVNMDFIVDTADDSQCFLHGAVHWVVRKSVLRLDEYGDDDWELEIWSIDLGSEEFKRMALPSKLWNAYDLHYFWYSILVLGGLLSVCVQPVDEPRFDIWVKADYYAE